MNNAYIFDAVRTPRGKGSKKGALSGTRPIELLEGLYGALEQRGCDPDQVAEVILGCVHAVGDQGSNIAKVSALYAGWPSTVGGATINRFCASGLDALRIAALDAEVNNRVSVAGGVESLSRVPMFADQGCWFADPDVAKRTGFVQMGVAADLLATREKFERKELDEVAVRSHQRAALAQEKPSRSLVPVERDGAVLLAKEECIRPSTTIDSISGFEAAFGQGDLSIATERRPDLVPITHVHHRGNSPGLADGAALVLVGPKTAGAPVARFLSFANLSVEPTLMLDGNVECSQRALKAAGMQVEDMDLFEVNESFAAVPLHFQRSLGIDWDKLNPNGGAIAMGHPLGATGGILVAAAIDELERADKQFALVSICGGAGVTVSAVIERV